MLLHDVAACLAAWKACTSGLRRSGLRAVIGVGRRLFLEIGCLFVGFLVMRALPLGVYIRARDFLETPGSFLGLLEGRVFRVVLPCFKLAESLHNPFPKR